MRQIYISLLTFVLATFAGFITPLFGQYYFELEKDASGFDTAPFQEDLNAAAQELCHLLDSLGFEGQFKVFSAGFYAEQEFFKRYSYDSSFAQLKASALTLSPYYLLIGRETNSLSFYNKITVTVNLPTSGTLNCISQLSPSYIKNIEKKIEMKINQYYNSYSKDPSQYFEAEKLGIQTLLDIVSQLSICCQTQNKGNSATCAECVFDASEFRSIIKQSLSERFGFEDYQVTNCKYSMQSSPIDLSPFVDGPSDIELNIDNNLINLYNHAKCAVAKYHESNIDAKSYIINSFADCNDFLQLFNNRLKENIPIKIFYLFIKGEDNISCQVISFSIINLQEGPWPDFLENCNEIEKEALIYVGDKVNYYYWENSKKISTEGYILNNQDCLNKVKEILDKNGYIGDDLKAAKTIHINPSSKIYGYYICKSSSCLANSVDPCKVYASTGTKKWFLNSVDITPSSPNDALSLYNSCKEGENILRLVFNNSAGQKILDAEIIIVKAKPEILLTIQSMNFSDNRVLYSANISEEDRQRFEIDLKEQYQYCFLATNCFLANVKDISAEGAYPVVSSTYLDGKAETKIAVRAFFRNHENKFFIYGGPREEFVDQTLSYFRIDWIVLNNQIVPSKELSDSYINAMPDNFLFTFNAKVYATSDESKVNLLQSFNVDILKGSFTSTMEFEVYVENESNIFVPKKNYLGEIKRYKSNGEIGFSKGCEIKLLPGKKIRIKAFRDSGTTLKEVDWALTEATTNTPLNNVHEIEFEIPEINRFFCYIYQNGTQSLLGNLKFDVMLPDNITYQSNLPQSEIGELHFNSDLSLTIDEKKEYSDMYMNSLKDLETKKTITLFPKLLGPNASIPVSVQVENGSSNVFTGSGPVNPLTPVGLAGISFSGFKPVYPGYLNLGLREITYEPIKLSATDYFIIKGAVLIVPISSDEYKCAFNVQSENIPNELVDNLINSLKSGTVVDPADKTDILNAGILYTAGQTHVKPVNGFTHRAMKKSEVSDYYSLQSIGNVYLNHTYFSAIKDKDEKKAMFKATTFHELSHTVYPSLNIFDKLKWMIIRKKYENHDPVLVPNSILGDYLGGNNSCSEGPGHEKYNPESPFVCGGGN